MISKIWQHLKNWQSIYLFLPLAILAFYGFRWFAFNFTGREPTENADWLVGNAGNLLKCVFVIFFVELYRQQTGVWLTKEEQIENPQMAWSQRLGSSVALCVFSYLLSH